MLRLVLVDDHKLFREGLRVLLGSHPDLAVVGEAHDAREASLLIARLKPDIAVVDMSLPGTSGVALTREIRRMHADCRVLALSMHVSPDLARDVLEAGGSGYALKDQEASEIVAAIRQVAAGERYLAPALPASILTERTRPTGGPLDKLSRREREIFDLIIRGFTTDAIAAELCISTKTVETHRTHLNAKLDVHSSAELILFAVRHGLITG